MSGNLRRQVDASCGGVPELGRLFRAKWPPYRLTFPVGGDPCSVELPAKIEFSSTKQGAAVGKRRLY